MEGAWLNELTAHRSFTVADVLRVGPDRVGLSMDVIHSWRPVFGSLVRLILSMASPEGSRARDC